MNRTPVWDYAPGVFAAWRDLHQDGRVGPDQQARIATGQSATRIRAFGTSLVPGLLQARSWAMALAEPSVALGPQGAPVDGLVGAELRLARQRILAEPGREIYILMTLAPLRCGKSPAVLGEQIEHLLHATGASTYRFGVVPDFAVTTADPIGDFFLYDLPGGALVEIATLAGEVRSTAREDVELCGRVFEEFAAIACYGQDARALLAAFATEAAAAGRALAASLTTGRKD